MWPASQRLSENFMEQQDTPSLPLPFLDQMFATNKLQINPPPFTEQSFGYRPPFPFTRQILKEVFN